MGELSNTVEIDGRQKEKPNIITFFLKKTHIQMLSLIIIPILHPYITEQSTKLSPNPLSPSLTSHSLPNSFLQPKLSHNN
jgi:hypothetical protein